MDKKELRRKIITARKNIPSDLFWEKSKAITARLSQLECYKEAQRLLVYCSYNNEADTGQIIEDALTAGKEVYVPKVIVDDKTDVSQGIMKFFRILNVGQLVKGYMGIKEPDIYLCTQLVHSPDKKELIVCPLVAFDEKCNRIGYGGGFYDRYLAGHRLKSVGIAFEIQKTKKIIESDSNDYPLDMIVSENTTYYREQ